MNLLLIIDSTERLTTGKIIKASRELKASRESNVVFTSPDAIIKYLRKFVKSKWVRVYTKKISYGLGYRNTYSITKKGHKELMRLTSMRKILKAPKVASRKT